MHKLLHYIVLFFIITFAVTSGNLLSNYVTTLAAGLELQKMIQHSNNVQTENNQIRHKKNQQQLQRDQINRQNNRLGKTLATSCVDWLNMAKTTPTFTTKAESKKHCEKYNTYVDTGEYKK